MISSVLRLAAAACLAAALASAAAAQTTDGSRLQRSMDVLIAAYPDFLERTDGNALVWKDGTRMVIDDGLGAKTHEALLATADIKDMFFAPYTPGAASQPPAVNADPGRARNLPFFNKMYGDCLTGGVARNLVDVVWLPKKWGKTLKVTRVNGVDKKLAAVSRELDELPARFDAFLFPSAGTYVCRVDRRHRPRQRSRPWHRHRHRHHAIRLLALDQGQARRPHRLQQPHPHGDRRDLREARLHLGRQVVPLRHHALRVPAGDHRGVTVGARLTLRASAVM